MREGINHQLDPLKTALADRYEIEREIGSGGMATVYCGVCVSRAESPRSAAQGEKCVLKDAFLGRARPLRAGLPTEAAEVP